MRPRLYPSPQQEATFPYEDYHTLMALVEGAKSVLEFGPGFTTWALIEAGVEKIVSLESNPDWLREKAIEFREYPQAQFGLYHDEPVVKADEVADQKFDIALVDAPAGFSHVIPGRISRKAHPGMEQCSRLNTCLFALERAPVVLLHDARRPLERGTLGELWKRGYRFEIYPTRGGIAKIWQRELS